MAENLTIESSNAGQLAKDLLEQQNRLDSNDPSIARLLNLGVSPAEISQLLSRGIPKEQIGAIIFNRARLSKTNALKESKEAYTQSISKEVITSNASQNAALKTTGVEQVQNVDGLSSIQRKEVTSNPKGHVYLPASSAEPIDADTAKTLLDNTILNFMIGENGLPLTTEEVLTSLKTTSAPTTPSSTQNTSFKRFTPAQPIGIENTNSALSAPGVANTSLSLNLKSQKKTGSGSATGALSSTWNVGDVSINSNKLFSMLTQFLFDHQEELMEIMKDQRELRNELAETATQALKTLKAFKEQAIRKEEMDAIQSAIERLVEIPQKAAQADVQSATGTGAPNQQAQQSLELLQKKAETTREARSENDPLKSTQHTLLTDTEIADIGTEAYAGHIDGISQSQGFGFTADLIHERSELKALQDDPSIENTAELDTLINQYDQVIKKLEERNEVQFNQAIKSNLHASVACQEIDRLSLQSTQLEQKADQINGRLSEIENEVQATPAPTGDALTNLQNEQTDLLQEKNNLEKEQFKTAYQYTHAVDGVHRFCTDPAQTNMQKILHKGKAQPITPEIANEPALPEVSTLKMAVPFMSPEAPEITGHASEGARDYYTAIVDNTESDKLNTMNDALGQGQVPENFSDFRQAGNNVVRGVASQVGNFNENDAVHSTLQTLYYANGVSDEAKRFAEEQGYEALQKTQEMKQGADAKFKQIVQRMGGMVNQLVALQYRTFRA
jgi:hypothetical protein